MSADKTTQALGTIHTEPMNRDAIHIAVAPITLAQILSPGDPIALVPGTTDEGMQPTEHVKAIGILDPFITRRFLNVGERCFVFLYPMTITGLRHVWSHPAFPETTLIVVPPPVTQEPAILNVARQLGWTYEETAARAGEAAQRNESMSTWDNEMYDQATPAFWDAVYRVTGFRHKDPDRAWFSCAC